MRMYGGKGVVGKRISAVILEFLKDNPDAIYIEPFVGMCGVLKHMAVNFKKCYANDLQKDLIMLLKEVKNNKFENPKITREKWLKLKYTTKSSAERAFAGFGCSFCGIWFNGFIDDSSNNDMEYSSLLKLVPKLQNTVFSNKNYIDFLKEFPFNSSQKYVIYLDPPYKGTCNLPWPEFDSIQFWNIIRKLGKMKNIKVFISEFSSPKDFKCICSFKRRNGLHNITNDKIILEEKLFTI